MCKIGRAPRIDEDKVRAPFLSVERNVRGIGLEAQFVAEVRYSIQRFRRGRFMNKTKC